MIMLHNVYRVGEAEGAGELDFIFRLVVPVASAAFGVEKDGRGEALLSDELGSIVGNAVLIAKFLCLKICRILIVKCRRETEILTADFLL